jgi:solute carrier family 1 (high affinity glutamate transporter) protein 2
LEAKAKLVGDICDAFNNAMLQMLKWLMVISPIGIASLIAEAVFSVENLSSSIEMILILALITTASIVVYVTAVLSALYWLFTFQNPFHKYVDFFETSFLAFATNMQYACMQKAIECCEQKLGVDSRITRFCIPFYTTLQSTGSCIFILISCVFLAKFDGHQLNAQSYLVISVMSIFLSLSKPSVPYISNAMILIVLKFVGINSPNIALLYPFDWFIVRYLYFYIRQAFYRLSPECLLK